MTTTQPTPEAWTGWSLPALEALVRARVPGAAGEMRLTRIAGGQSNPTFFVAFDNRSLVLRKKPLGPLLPSAHAIDREYRIQAALAGSAVPVPPLVHFEADESIVGTAFYLMEKVEGRVFHRADLAEAPAGERRAMYLAMARTLAALHDVDWRQRGLADFGRHDGYFARQINRWSRQLEQGRDRPTPELDAIGAWLAAHLPPDDALSIVHGDYRLGNLLFWPDAPQVAAVLDWELATLGHPLADLAHSAMSFRAAPDEYGGIAGLDREALGLPSETEYLDAYYAARGGGPVPMIGPFHMGFALYRFALVFEGIAARVRAGTASADDAESAGKLSGTYARLAAEAISL